VTSGRLPLTSAETNGGAGSLGKDLIRRQDPERIKLDPKLNILERKKKDVGWKTYSRASKTSGEKKDLTEGGPKQRRMKKSRRSQGRQKTLRKLF